MSQPQQFTNNRTDSLPLEIRKCRCCLQTRNLLEIKIQEENFQNCTSVRSYRKNDGVSQFCCARCLKKLNEINKFQIQCLSSDLFLKSEKFPNSQEIKQVKLGFRTNDKKSKRIEKSAVVLKECSIRLEKLDSIPPGEVKTEPPIKLESPNFEEVITSIFNSVEDDIKTEEDRNLENDDDEKKEYSQNDDVWNNSNDDDGDTDESSSSESKKNVRKSKSKINPENRFKRMKCTICQRDFCAVNYNKHMKKHRPIILSECPTCKKIVENLEIHETKKHKKKYSCVQCGEIFDCNRKLTIHRFRLHEKPEHVCNICGKSYIFSYMLKQHQKHNHTTDTKGICDICGKTFTNPQILAGHRASHIIERKINKDDIDSIPMRSEINTFKCPHCSLQFRNLFGLQNHVKHHNKLKNTEAYKHVCEFCNQRFNRSDHLQLHLDLVHLNNLPFECKICSRRFVKQYVLNQHVKRNHEAQSHVCQYCNKEYAFRVSLTRHIRSHHLMMKRFKCDICGEAFITGIECKKHMQNHTLEEERETAQRIYGEIMER